ncbi:SDR family NAD(P)-dependent oxidoreductase [Lentzea cavernae]|uniref:Short chain dehydrogenase n=1 Tax=Lentzea cavernae TaxID=2020703 RepID=A0ABQ3M675_9PSEU|nr:SDR family NAD(P)-dependent oxidoreductase [Lentzea cavernae]GHH32635.1 hypothetical protein GCM10017774_13840 [Lentzea cavernae]
MIRSSFPTALVTGGSNGTGYKIASALLADGHAVVLHAPKAEQSWEAAQRLVECGADPARLHPVAADFAHLDEIVMLARQIAAGHPVLDLIVNAATVIGTDGCTITENGSELAVQVHDLAPVLLTKELVESMGRSSTPRVLWHHSGIRAVPAQRRDTD